MPAQNEYLAFISYRHADNKVPGRQWATWLHQALETYQVPEDLVGQTNDRGDVIPARIFPVFRDEDELPADADLANSITRALDNSRTLIVLCSPNAVASTYVADEIHYFKSLGRSDRIIAAIIAGEPNCSWDQSKRTLGFTPEQECFPEPLQFAYDDSGKATQVRAEPIAADFRFHQAGQAQQGWTSIEALRQSLKEQQDDKSTIDSTLAQYQEQQHLMLLKIIAGILGVPLGALTQRDKEYQLALAKQKARRLRQWLSAVAVLAMVAITAGVFAYFKQQEAVANEQVAQQQRAVALENEALAKEQRDQSLIGQSRFLLDQARQANEDKRYEQALLLGLNALPGVYGGERPVVEQLSALREAVLWNRKKASFTYPERVLFAEFLSQKKMIVVNEKQALIESLQSSQPPLMLDIPLTGRDGFSVATVNEAQDKLFLATKYGDLIVYSIPDKTITRFKSDKMIEHLISVSTDQVVLALARDGTLLRWNFIANTLDYQQAVIAPYFSSKPKLSVSKRFLVYEAIKQIKDAYQYWTQVIDISNGQLMFEHQSSSNFVPEHLKNTTFDNDNILILQDEGFAVFEIETGKTVNQNKQQYAAISPNFEYFALFAIDTQSRKEIGVFHQPSQSSFFIRAGGDMTNLVFSPDSKKLATVHFGVVYIWDLTSGLLVNKLKLNSDQSFSFSADSKYLVSTDRFDGKVGIWSTEAVYQSKKFPTLYDNYSAKLSADGSKAVLRPIDQDSRIDIIDLNSMTVMAQVNLNCRINGDIQWWANGSIMTYQCWDDQIVGYSIEKQQPLTLLHPNIADSAKGKIVNAENLVYYHNSWREPKRIYLKSKLFSLAAVPSEQADLSDDFVNQDTVLWENSESTTLNDFALNDSLDTLIIMERDSAPKIVQQGESRTIPGSDAMKNCKIVYTEPQLAVWFTCQTNQLHRYLWADQSLQTSDEIEGEIKQVTSHSRVNFLLLLSDGKKLHYLDKKSLQPIKAPRSFDGNLDVSFSHDARFYFFNKSGVEVYLTNNHQRYLTFPYDAGQTVASDGKRILLIQSQAYHPFIEGKSYSQPVLHTVEIIDDELAKKARNALPINEYCLSNEQRLNYYLFPLTDEQREQRGCQ
ncbi:MAG: TIR domain-containing protein [Gammaproteobacteria bacterium]|nr:TIR domain-containing protein [Gammaproteobacteria bacterium]